ncbi:hypothetical protein AJ79_07638 [Helicocarpus griseus UAMH5409]|uniref:Uncharacterized protein n=1 Tax=Helicocarpus griseus UAMH5409 TaxID=1447875 RepID=A0A2B7X033_9EURO|nr:hypothetical protein AJ79_07638 [Helicocarpus griseus UAMH5409]
MAGRSMDAFQCFTYISDNVPSWVTRVTDLAAHTKAKHAEFSAEYAKLTAAGGGIKTRRRKNSSMHSIKPDDMDKATNDAHSNKEEEEAVEDGTEDYMDPITLLKMSKHYPQDANQRKRNIATSKSENTDRIVRPRQLVVVHYDSETQSSLEQLVRDIGGARNNIRKGRMSQMMKSGFGLKFFDPTRGRAAAGRKHPLDPSSKPSSPSQNKESPFDAADKQLELAQSLCESAAHQFLRCGDCAMELEKTKERFSTVLDMAKVEIERLEAEAKEQKEAEKAEEEAEREVEPVKEEIAAEPTLVKDEEKRPPGIVTAIEVDDGSSVSSVSIDITAFRSSRFRV